MRRLLCCISLVLTIALVAPAASEAAPRSGGATVDDLIWARRVNFYLFGSGANPLVNNACGRVFRGVFVLNSTIEPGAARHCTIPHGMPVVGLAGGIFSYGLPPGELRPDVDAGLASIVNLQARLDGQSLRKRLVKSFVHPLKLQPGNLLQELDPTVTGTSTLVATGTWLVWIRNLTVGDHRVFLAATFDDGVTLDLTVNLRVQ